MLAVAAVVAIPLCLLSLVFAEDIMHWKWFEWHSWPAFLVGYLINHNAHQPNAVGQFIGEYLFWFFAVLILMGTIAAGRFVVNRRKR